MKKIFTVLCLMALTLGAQAQPVIQENVSQRQHITDPGNLTDGDVIMLQATEQTQKYLGGSNHTTDGTSDSYWQLVASGSSFKLVKYITTATGGTPTYIKAPTATGQDPIQMTTTESEAALFTFSTPAANYIRFTTKVNNTGADTYLNCNSSYTTAKFATGTGGWSYWKVFKVSTEIKYPTEAQQAAFDKVGEWFGLIQSQALITDASNYLSAHRQQDNEGLYPSLLDKDNSTYFHSAWGGSMASDPDHDLQARLPEATSNFYIYYVVRNNGTGYPQGIRIDGSNNESDFTEAGGSGWTTNVLTLGSDGMPTAASASYLSEKITLPDAYRYLRFIPNVSYKSTYWFCLAEFWLLPSNEATDAAFTMMKSVTSALDLTDEQIAQINQIDEDLRNTVAKVTYVVEDESGNPLFTSDPQEVAKGTTITTLPTEFQRAEFYNYNTVSTTVNSDETITFTATLKEEPLFKFTADATSPVWYFLTLSATPNYVTYTAGGAQNVTLPTTNADDETTHWAFIGNPYAGFTIVNEAAGTSLVLGSDATTGSANNGRNVYATLATEGSQTNEVWTVISSSYRTNGFFLQNTEGHRLNMRNGTANVSYWTTGSDAGSTFVATKVPGLAELIPEAETLLSDLTAGADDVQIGYPTADALSTFSSAIDAAKDILNNGGDEATAIAALKAAMNAVRAFESINYTPRTDVYYTITSGRGSMVYDASHSGQVDSKYGNEFLWYSNSLDKTNANHQWGFIKVDGKYYMYNVGKKQFANVTQGGTYQGSNGDKHTWMFSNSPSSVTLDAGEGNWVVAPKVRVRATSEVTGKQYAMSISTSYVGPVIAYDAVNDGGIPMTFAIATTEQDDEVTAAIEALLNDPTPYKEALQEAINEANTFLTNLENYPIGEGLNQYTMTGDTDALSSAVAAGGSELENADATKESLLAAIQAINDAKEAISLSLNMPTVGKFYRIKTAKAWSETNAEAFNNTQPYLTGENHSTQINGTTRAAFSTTAGEDASSIWYLTTIGESPTQYLVNFSNGRPAVNNSNFLGVGKDAQFLSPNGTSIVFKAATNGEIGAYGIVFNAGGRALYTNVNLYTDAGGANGSGDGYNFQLEEVTTLPITMNDGLDGKHYATFSAPVAISSITGATAHKVKVENEKAKYSETGVEGIPAGTGVLLINETGENAMLTIGDFTDAIDTDLRPITAAVSSHEGLFFGLSTENKLGFFKLMEGGETTPTTGGFKAYLDGAVTPTGAKGVELVADNEATGVEAIDNSEFAIDNAPVYNLQGQRVNKAQKGVFIQNGKKVVMK